MRKQLAVVIGGVLIILCAVLYVINQPKAEPASNPTVSEVKPSTQTDAATPPPIAPTSDPQVPGKYVDYASDVVANSKGTKLLFFHAPWCPQCRMLDADIKKTTLPSGVTVFKTDYDSHQDLRKKYGITIQTSFVRIDAEGNLVERYVAYDDPQWSKVAENLL